MHTLTPSPRRPKVDRSNEAVTAFGRPLHRITVEQYHRMQENGAIRREDRCELINGILLQRPRISPQHASCSSRMLKELFKLLKLRIRSSSSAADHTPR